MWLRYRGVGEMNLEFGAGAGGGQLEIRDFKRKILSLYLSVCLYVS
jgi:hypothetical protein